MRPNTFLFGCVVCALAFRPGLPTARADEVSYEVRAQLVGTFLPEHRFDADGKCATGTTLAPASLFVNGKSERGEALGVGLGARLVYRLPADANGIWGIGLRAGAGFDLNVLYGSVPTGFKGLDAELCSRIRDEAAIEYKQSTVLYGQVVGTLGVELAAWADAERPPSRAFVLTAAWAPAVGYLKPWVANGEWHASYVGTEVSLDMTSLAKGSRGATKRLALFALFPVEDGGPMFVVVSFGGVYE
jgi:hypothetical protein